MPGVYTGDLHFIIVILYLLIIVSVLQFLIGYKQGLVVWWDNEEGSVLQTYAASQV